MSNGWLVGWSVGLSVMHSFDDPHVAPYWPTWPCFSLLDYENSATYFWPGSEVDWNGIRPDHFMKYEQKVPFETRVKTAIQWLMGKL